MILKFEQYRLVPMILVMGTIFFLSHQSGDTIDMPDIPDIDKVAHFAIYAVLAVSVILAHKSSFRKNFPLRVSLYTSGVCLLYGISDEFHQSFIPGRFVSGADLLADMVGSVTVCTIWMLWAGRRASQSMT